MVDLSDGVDIALIQDYTPSDAMDAFREGLESIKNAANAGADLVVFPELSFTKFYPRIPAAEREGDVLDLAEPVPGPTTEAIADAAREYGVVVVFNLYERAGDEAYDTSVVVDADGTVLGGTRMMHIAHYENFHELDYYTPGNTGAPVYDTAVGRVGVATCYDRHYPEYMRALALQDADIVAVPQAGAAGEWPGDMMQQEMQVAAFQNGFFVALANRVGREGNLLFGGSSFVADPEGSIVANAPSAEAIVLMACVNFDKCNESSGRKLFLPDRRPDQYERGAVSLAASVPVASEALADADGPEPGAGAEE
jgi:N-carbamoylputrescine amidase